MKNLIIVFLLVFNLSVFSQEKSSNDCIEVTVERLDYVRVKVVEYNKCTNVYTVKSYLTSEWNKIEADRKKKRKKKDKKQK